MKTSYEMLVDAQSKGAQFILNQPEYLSATTLSPAILTGVTKDMKLWDEESFGPSTTVVVVEDHQQAIRIVNESNYGLDAILFTKDMRKALEIARELQVGRIRVNSVGHEGKQTAKSTTKSLTRHLSDFPNEPCQRKRLRSEQWPSRDRRISAEKGRHHGF